MHYKISFLLLIAVNLRMMIDTRTFNICSTHGLFVSFTILSIHWQKTVSSVTFLQAYIAGQAWPLASIHPAVLCINEKCDPTCMQRDGFGLCSDWGIIIYISIVMCTGINNNLEQELTGSTCGCNFKQVIINLYIIPVSSVMVTKK